MDYPFLHLCFLSITFLVLITFTTPSSATFTFSQSGSLEGPDITNIKIMQNFTGKADIYIDIRSITISSKVAPFNASRAGFFYASSPAFSLLQHTLSDGSCLVGANDIAPILTFDEFSTRSYEKIVTVESREEYTLFYQNCEIQARITLNSTYQITTPGLLLFHHRLDFHAVFIMYITSFVFFIYLAVWTFICLKNRNYITKYYVLMGDLLLVKCIDSILQVNSLTAAIIITWLFYIFVFVLILQCCLILKDFLTKKKFWVILILLTLQCFDIAEPPSYENIFWMPNSFRPVPFNFYGILLFFVGNAIFSVVIIALLKKSIDGLTNTLSLGGMSSRGLECLRLFFKAYIGFVVYYMVVCVGVSVFVLIVEIKVHWVILAVQELMGLLFCGFIMYIFRPCEWNLYLLSDVQLARSTDVV